MTYEPPSEVDENMKNGCSHYPDTAGTIIDGENMPLKQSKIFNTTTKVYLQGKWSKLF